MLLNRHIAAGGVVVYKSPQLAAVGVGHAFSTRVGGVSGPPFDSMNLGNPMGADVQDSAANLAENYGRFMAASGLAGVRRHWTWQVHGPGVTVVGPGEFVDGCKADALVTTEPGRAVSVRSADCCPVLLATVDGRAVGGRSRRVEGGGGGRGGGGGG